MRTRITIAALYTQLHVRNAKQRIVDTKDKVIEHKSEMARLAGTAVVVGVVARVNGFNAGYEFAKTDLVDTLSS